MTRQFYNPTVWPITRKSQAYDSFFSCQTLHLAQLWDCFLHHTSGAFIFLFHFFFHIRWLVKTGNGPVAVSNSSNMRWQDGTVYFFDCWMGGALFKKESWRELDVYCLEGSILPLAHIPMLQKKLTVAKKDHSIFQLNKNIIFFHGYQHCYRLKKLELLFLTQPPFFKFEEWQPPKGIEHSFWRVRELVKKGTTQWCMISCH